MSVDRDNPILIGAAILLLVGEDDDDLSQFDAFRTAMTCYDYGMAECYHVVEDIDNAYERKILERQ